MENNISQTYKESAETFIANEMVVNDNAEQGEGAQREYESKFNIAQEEAIKEFAKYLDSFAVLDDKMQILAYQKAREVDREVLFAVTALLPKEKVEEVVREVYAKHKHKKNDKGPTTTSQG